MIAQILGGTFQNNILRLILAFAVITALYYVIPKKKRLYFLFGANVLFYLLCDYKMFAFLAAETVWTFLCGGWMGRDKNRKGWLIAGIVPVVLALFGFKYFGFFSESINAALAVFGIGATEMTLNLLIPLGISYYSFRMIGYQVDVYKRKYIPETNFISYAVYTSFVAHIISGPIERYDRFQKSVSEGLTFRGELAQKGFMRILLGLFMKAVIANRLAGYVSAVFSSPETHPSLALWLAAFFYSVQLYCDFAGYSEIAVGFSNLLGFDTIENFRRPYLSTNIRDFWSRWHISLSSWLRDYLYIQLGGNRCSKLRRAFNVMVTFLVCGMWHGAGWNFLFWGGYHGVLNILTPREREKKHGSVYRLLSALLTFVPVMFGWIFFGSSSLSAAFAYIKQMFSGLAFDKNAIVFSIMPFTGDNTCAAFFLTVCLFILIMLIFELLEDKRKKPQKPLALSAWQVFFIVSTVLFGVFGASSFIYANF